MNFSRFSYIRSIFKRTLVENIRPHRNNSFSSNFNGQRRSRSINFLFRSNKSLWTLGDCGPILKSKVKASILQQEGCLIYTSTRRAKDGMSNIELKKSMEQLTEQFMEARELIDDARESMDTVYFSEDMAEAQEAIMTTLNQYQTLLARLSEDQKQDVLRTIGLKMEELKAQEQAINDELKDSH